MKIGKTYKVYANIGKIYYDEKQKNGNYMDAGTYDSVQIVIGEGKGSNWWALVYPYAYDAFVFENNISEDKTKTDDTNHISTYDIVSSENITIKFGILDLICSLFK